MEIQTTVKESSRKIRMLNLDPDTTIRIIVDNMQRNAKGRTSRSTLDFLHSGFWDEKEGLRNISRDHDNYIYDSEDPHGSR